MKSFDDIINGNVNEGMADKWARVPNPNIGEMLKDIMKEIDYLHLKINDLLPQDNRYIRGDREKEGRRGV